MHKHKRTIFPWRSLFLIIKQLHVATSVNIKMSERRADEPRSLCFFVDSFVDSSNGTFKQNSSIPVYPQGFLCFVIYSRPAYPKEIHAHKL